jgi:ribosome-associated toxin RatA of RatAB toxin-antitoxin module
VKARLVKIGALDSKSSIVPENRALKTVQKSVLIWYSPKQMYDLVVGVPDYPKFLPWCDKARVVELREDGMTAEIGIAFSGIHQTFTTRNTHVPGREVRIQLVNGPFSELEGHWTFSAVGADPAQQACKVELTLAYGFSNALLGKLVGPVFDKIAATFVDAFIKRAEQVYGAN